MVKRLPALDGLRGCLACVVLVSHVFDTSVPLNHLAHGAVVLFFVISGHVLARSWDRRFGWFLVRRFLRLWPTYAVCLGAGFLLSGGPVIWSQFFWYPLIGANDHVQIDPPAWTLCIEAWAMLAMPFFVWAGRSFIKAELGILACALAAYFEINLLFGAFFIVGTWLARFDIRLALLEWWLPRWLGRISYSLYLSHWLVLRYVPASPVVTVPLAFLIATVMAETLEKWSIAASRAVRPNRPTLPGKPAPGGANA